MNDLTPQNKKEVLDSLKIIDGCMHRQDAEKGLIKAEKKKIRDALDMKTKAVNRLAKAFFRSNFGEEKEEFEEFETIFKAVLPNGV
jgi:hypothetical protein